jgi:RNA polymerase sigma-70 factor (ECF subfamily)
MMMGELDSIIDRVLDGQTEAYAEIVRRYQREVGRIVVAMLGDPEKTADLVQQVFVDAFLHLDQFQRGRDFGAWIKEIARNRVRQELRSLVREERRLAVYRQRLLARLTDERASSRFEQDYLDALRQCQEQLPEQSAELVRRRYIQRQSFEEIAASQESTPGAIQRMLSRIRLALRACVEARLAEA